MVALVFAERSLVPHKAKLEWGGFCFVSLSSGGGLVNSGNQNKKSELPAELKHGGSSWLSVSSLDLLYHKNDNVCFMNAKIALLIFNKFSKKKKIKKKKKIEKIPIPWRKRKKNIYLDMSEILSTRYNPATIYGELLIFGIKIYVFTQPLRRRQDLIQGQFLSEVILVGIQRFPSLWLVA